MYKLNKISMRLTGRIKMKRENDAVNYLKSYEMDRTRQMNVQNRKMWKEKLGLFVFLAVIFQTFVHN